MLKVETITTIEGFRALEAVWNSLLQQSTSNSITLTFEWLSTWWEIFHEGRELYILVVRDGETLIGIAPMGRRTVQHYGLLPFRRLEFLASGEDEADEICSDYLNFILLTGRESEALRAILECIYADQDWDEMLLTDMLGESASQDELQRFCGRKGMSPEVVKNQISIYLPLTNDFGDLVKHLSSSVRRRIKQDQQTFSQYGGKIRIVDTVDDFDEAFETVMALHQARWTSRGKPGVFASRKFTEFHRRLGRKAMRNGWLRIYFAERQGKPFASIYNFIYNGKVHYYQSGLRLEESGLRSPGMLLQRQAIEDAVKMGLREYDFLKGEPGSYKFKWEPLTRPVIGLRLAQPRAKEALYKTTGRVIAGLRTIRKSLIDSAASQQ